MKRIRFAKGKYVTISTDLADKAARAFGAGLSLDEVRRLAALEPSRDRCTTDLTMSVSSRK